MYGAAGGGLIVAHVAPCFKSYYSEISKGVNLFLTCLKPLPLERAFLFLVLG